MKNGVLFLDTDHVASRIAQIVAQEYAAPEVRIDSAGVVPSGETPELIQALKSINVSWGQSVPVGHVAHNRYDLVVVLCESDAINSLVFPGIPPVLKWKIIQPNPGTPESFRKCTDSLIVNIRDLFTKGYFHALKQQTGLISDVLDSLNDGIIAHGLDRNIIVFSKGAERLTGVKREDALGRDCHDIIKPDFCGEQCLFCDKKHDYSKMETSSYSTLLLGDDGERKELDVTRVPFRNERGHVIGAIATIHDNTKMKELEAKLAEIESFSGIIGQDYKMLEVFALIRDLAGSDFPVIITGESGTGKELVAAAVHKESRRRDKLFVPVNCGALPEGTLESELFGHVKGSFTGAIRDKKGRFELADNGTLFLDEIGELSLRMQVKLLRVLQEGVFEPVGSEHSKKVDVRIICATNRNLKEMVAAGTFREDLFYRLAVVPIEIPPLRDRRNDIPLLVKHFLSRNSLKSGTVKPGISDDALSYMMNYRWPGNVRQLQNAIQFALIKSKGTTIQREHLPPEITSAILMSESKNFHTPGKAGRKPKLASDVVEKALRKAGGNKAKAARILGVGRATLYNFIGTNKNVLDVFVKDDEL
jgi:PAS domain S-box-containing protein